MNKQATSARRAQKETEACGAALVRKGAADHRAVSAEAAAEEESDGIRRCRGQAEEAGEESDGIRRCKGQAEEAGADPADPAAVEPAVLAEEEGGLQAAAADNIQEKEMT